jgi:CheY-like chemotaxis protein
MPLSLTQKNGASAKERSAGRIELGFDVSLRVLIADDYPDAAQSLAMFFSHAGLETEVAGDGASALVRASEWRPQVCVLDIDMPKLDGYEVARRIRQLGWVERPLLIALTGWTGASNRQSAFDAGFDHWICKPAEPLQLARLIHDHLQGMGVSQCV